jgi:hypothetical protein
MQDVINSITNRDLALCFWILVLIAWSFSKAPIRHALFSLLDAFTNRQILMAFGLAAATTAAYSYLFCLFGIWTLSQLKGTAAWFLFACALSMMDISNLSRNSSLFRKVALKNFELSILVDFYINMFHAHFLVELIILPIATTLTAMLVLSEKMEEFKPAISPLKTLLAIVGTMWLLFETYKLFTSFREIMNINTARDFALPLLLNLSFLPALFLFAAYTAYDSVFSRIQFIIKDPSLRTFTKIILLLQCQLNYMRLHEWAKSAWHEELTDREKILQSIRKI